MANAKRRNQKSPQLPNSRLQKRRRLHILIEVAAGAPYNGAQDAALDAQCREIAMCGLLEWLRSASQELDVAREHKRVQNQARGIKGNLPSSVTVPDSFLGVPQVRIDQDWSTPTGEQLIAAMAKELGENYADFQKI